MGKAVKTPNLIRAIERTMRRKQEEDRWDTSKLHVSDLAVALPLDDGGRCPRQLWGRFREWEEKPPRLGEMMRWEYGHTLHELLVEWISESLGSDWSVVGVEMAVEEYLPAEIESGSSDYVLVHVPTGFTVIVDFKTQRGRAFPWLQADGPKSSHVRQVQTYMKATNADLGIILYVDREGDNHPLQFSVKRDDAWVEQATKDANMIRNLPVAPAPLGPQLKINRNKGPDSVKLKQPWQCDYCPLQDVSCDGALPPELRELSGVIGHIKKGRFVAKDDTPDSAVEIVEALLQEQEEIAA